MRRLQCSGPSHAMDYHAWTHFSECPKASLLIRPSFAFVNIPVDVKTTSYQKPTSPHHNAARTNQPYSCTPSPPLWALIVY